MIKGVIMLFKATNSPQGVKIDGELTGIANITGQKTESEGIVLIQKQNSIYLPNTVGDLKDLLNLLSKIVQSLATTQQSPAGAVVWSDGASFLTEINNISEALK
jgi:hypothetical protein